MEKSDFDFVRNYINSDIYITDIYKVSIPEEEKPTLKDAFIIISKGWNGSGLDFFFFSNTAIAEINPEEEPYITGEKDPPENLKESYKMKEGWHLGPKIYSGDLVYEDFELMIEDLENHIWSVEQDDDPMMRMLGFKCRSGRKWHISALNYKECCHKNPKLLELYPMRTSEEKEELLKKINTKLFFKYQNEIRK